MAPSTKLNITLYQLRVTVVSEPQPRFKSAVQKAFVEGNKRPLHAREHDSVVTMELTKAFCGFFEQEKHHLRYDQYRRSDPDEHKKLLAVEASAVDTAAAQKKMKLDFTTRYLPPKPCWCEEIVAKVRYSHH